MQATPVEVNSRQSVSISMEEIAVSRKKPIVGRAGETSLPLVVDLDGTLVKTDLLIESFFALIKQNSSISFSSSFLAAQGKGLFKTTDQPARNP